MNEMNQKIDEFKLYIKPKPKTTAENEMLRIHTNILALKDEMEKQFQVILSYMNNYFVINEKIRKGSFERLNTLASVMKNDLNNNEKENEISSEEESNMKNINIEKVKEENNADIKNNKDDKDKIENSFNFKYKISKKYCKRNDISNNPE